MTRVVLPNDLYETVKAMREAREPVRVINAWLRKQGFLISPSALWLRLRMAGINKPDLPPAKVIKRPKGGQRPKTLRNQAIVDARHRGASFQVIAAQFGISRSRAHAVWLARDNDQCYDVASCQSNSTAAVEPSPPSSAPTCADAT